jgi:hypothetical protein
MSQQIKLDLLLMKRFVKELEDSLVLVYENREKLIENPSIKESYYDYTINLSKSIGLLSGIAAEAGMLIGDLQNFNKSSLDENKSLNYLEKLLSSNKASNGSNN